MVTLVDGRTLNTHAEGQCALSNCSIHNPSDHPLNTAPMQWYGDGVDAIYRVCEHGVDHPDPDDLAFKNATLQWGLVEAMYSVHIDQCDGCCQPLVHPDDLVLDEMN